MTASTTPASSSTMGDRRGTRSKSPARRRRPRGGDIPPSSLSVGSVVAAGAAAGATAPPSDCPGSSVQVAVRVRPLLPLENGTERCVEVLPPNGEDKDTIAPSPGSGGRKRSRQRLSRSLRIGGDSGPTFTFDMTLPPTSSQGVVYAACVQPLVHQCLRGYNVTVLAYGQTGSGKTYTILGPANAGPLEHEEAAADFEGDGRPADGGEGAEEDSDKASASASGGRGGGSQAGVIPRALHDLFAELEETRSRANGGDAATDPDDRGGDGIDDEGDEASQAKGEVDPSQPSSSEASRPFEYEVRVQFLELYGEDVRDLLSAGDAPPRSRLAIRDGGPGVEPEVIGASEVTVGSAEEALLCLTRGSLRRVTGATAMNSESSRSHAIMSVVVEQTTTTVHCGAGRRRDEDDMGGSSEYGETTGETTDDGGGGNGTKVKEVEVRRSKFHFVDLAGSERQKRSLAKGKR